MFDYNDYRIFIDPIKEAIGPNLIILNVLVVIEPNDFIDPNANIDQTISEYIFDSLR